MKKSGSHRLMWPSAEHDLNPNTLIVCKNYEIKILIGKSKMDT